MMQRIPDGGVLCLVSKIPFFDFSFTLLDILRRNLTQAPAILERINKTSMAKLARGVEARCARAVLTIPLLFFNHFSKTFQWSRLLSPGCDWSQLAQLGRHDSLSPLSRTLARWQVWWGLLALLMRWGDRLLEVVLKLLPCVLLEQQVILFGDAQRTSVVALLLRSMLWPFKWQHLFVCAPWPPEELQSVPLMDCNLVHFGSLLMAHMTWTYRCYQSVHHLPSNIVAGVLRDRWAWHLELFRPWRPYFLSSH
ncbi:unnamed protein product [Durusdinium trenchii]|uniref:cDENN domain-containing protein n=1 Tax=Durusdinium trenchii TaxID=1381693 RepID=A0ABP0NXV1_9DINO